MSAERRAMLLKMFTGPPPPLPQSRVSYCDPSCVPCPVSQLSNIEIDGQSCWVEPPRGNWLLPSGGRYDYRP